MTETTATLPEPLREIVDEFKLAEGKEKLELLLEFSESLPPMPERFQDMQDDMAQVHECQAPVFIHAERSNGSIQFYFDIPESAPTVRGYAAILLEGTEGASPEEILQIPVDFFTEMGLHTMLSPQRLNGITAVLAHMKRMTMSLMEEDGE
ncbi:MAG: SufE family protein [Chloroflexota bacterium]